MENQNQNTNVIFPNNDGTDVPGVAPVAQEPFLGQGQSLDPVSGPQSQTPLQDIPPPTKQEKLFVRLAKRADVILAILLILGSLGLVISSKVGEDPAANNVTGRFETTEIPLNDLGTSQGISFGTQSVIVNGSLQTNNGLIVSPTQQPSSAVAGQIYYDQTGNTLAYYNGTQFVFLGGGVQNLGGLTGQVNVGGGLSSAGGQLSNSGVLSVQGVTGNVTLTAGNGITINGTTISNSGVVSVTSATPALTVTDDGNGNLTLTGSGAGTVSSSGGTAGVIPLFTAAQNIEDSIVSQSGLTVTVSGDLAVVTGGLSLSNALTVSNGGTGAASLALNGVLVGQGTSAITAVTAGGAGLCFVSTAGAPTFAACPGGSGVASLNSLTGALSIANASGAGSTVTIDDASTSTKGIAQFNSSNFSVGSGIVNTIQDINTGATPTFVGVNTNNITPSAALTVGVSGQTALLQGSTTTITSNGVGSDIILNSADTIELQDNTNVTGNVVASGDVAVNGGDLTASGALNITPGGTLTAGVSGQTLTLQGNASTTLRATDAGNTTIIGFVSPTANTTLNFPALSAGTYTFCTTSGNCSGSAVTLQAAYDNSTSPEIILDATRGALTIRDSLGGIGANLLEVQNNAGGTTYFGVTSTGVAVTGTAAITGNINSSGGALQTGSTTRVDASGNLTNIGSLTLSGAISGGTTYSGSGNINTTGGSLQTNSTTRIDNSGNLINIAAITASGNATLQGGTATLGTTSQQGSLVLHDGNGQTATLSVGSALAASTALAIPTAVGATDTVCLLTLANCASAGGGVTTPGGSTNRLAKFTGAQTIADSTITDNGTAVTTSVDLVIQGGDATLGVASSQTGTLNFAESSSAFLGSITQGALTANRTYTLPDADGDVCLSSGNCLGGGGGANTALSNLTGVAINTTLLPGAAGTINLGSGTLPFGELFLAGSSGTPATNNFRITGASTGGTRVITLPDATGTVCLQSSTACGFAPTSGSANYIQNQIASPQTADFNISGAGRAATFNATTGINTGAGAGTQRIDASGNLANIGTLTLSGAISGGTTVTGSGNFNTTGGALQTNSTTRVDNSGNLVNIAAITASGNATLQGGSVTLGTTSQAGSVIIHDGSSNTGTLQVAALGQNTVYTLPDPGAGTADICLTTGNCAGTGTGVTSITGGSTNRLAKFTAAQNIEDSTITDNGTTVSTTVDLVIQGGDVTVGVASSQIGSVNFAHSGSAFLGTIVQGALGANRTYTLPDASGDVCLSSGNCLGGGGGANTALSNLTGVAINTTLLPGAAGTIHLGSGTLPFGDIFLAGSSGTPGTNNFRITGASTSGTRVITLPDATGTVCLQNSTACGFAPSSGSANYIQNQIASPQTADFNISGDGRAATFNATTGINTGAGAGTQRIDASGNLVNIGTITTSGAINGQTVSSTANFTGTMTIQGANALTLGVTGTSTGAVLFKGSTAASGTLTLIGQANPTNNTLTLPNETGTICSTGSICSGYQAAGSFANTALSNLAGVAINTTLLPGAAGTIHLGSGTLPFGDAFLAGSSGTPGTNNFRITGASTSGTRVITLPDATGTVCLQNSTACGFAPSSGSANYIQNQIASPQTADFSISGAGRAATFNATTGINTGAVAGTQRIDASGNLVNIVALTLSGAISGGTTVTGSGNFNTTGGAIQTNSVTRIDNSGNLVNIVDITASGDAVLQGGSLTLGTTSQVGELVLHDGAGETGSLVVDVLGQTTTYNLPDPGAASAEICLNTGNCLGGGGGGANTALSNLTSVAINTTLLPGAAGTIHLGSGTLPFGDIFVAGSSGTPGTNNFRITGASTSGTRTITLPDATGTVCLQNSTACGFAAASGSANYIQNQIASPQTADFSISGAGRAATFNATTGINTGATAGTQRIDASGNLVNIGNLTATGAITIASTGAGNDIIINGADILDVQDAATFASTLGVTGTTTLSGDAALNGTNISLGNAATDLLTITAIIQGASPLVFEGGTADANELTLAIDTLTGDQTITFPDDTGTVCLTTGNCAGSGGGVTTSGGTPGTLAVFTGAQTIGDSLVSESGGVVTVNGHLNLTTGNQFRINGTQISSANLSNDANLAKLSASQTFTGNSNAFQNGTNSTNAFNVQNAAGTRVLTIDTTNGELELGTASTLDGKIVFSNVSNANTVTIVPGTPTGNRTITLPDDSGIVCLNSGNCAGAGSTLQTAYNFSVGGTTPKIKVNSTLGGVDIQDADTTIGADLFDIRASNGSGLGSVMFGVASTGAVTLQNAANSTTAFRVLSAGGTSVLTADTTNGQTLLGQSGTLAGNLVFRNATNANIINLTTAVASGTQTITLPDATGTVCLSSGNCSGSGTTNTLQAAYEAGNTITTLTARDINFTLADSATDSNFLVDLQCDTSCSTNGRFAVQNDGVDVLSVAPVTDTVTITNTSTTGTGLTIVNSNASQTTTTLLNVAQSGVTTGFTGNVVNLQGTSTTGTGTILNVSSANTTNGNAVNVVANGLTTGVGVNINSTSTGLTTGSLLRVSTGTTGAINTNGVVSLQATGNYTSTSNNGLLNVLANTTTAGTITNIQGTSLTTGVALNIGANTGTAIRVSSGLTSLTNATSGSGVTLTVSNSTSTGSIAVFQDNATTVASIADGGATTFQNQTDSTSAFRVLSATGGELIGVDSVDNVLRIFANTASTGHISAFTATNTLGTAQEGAAAVTVNGYIYLLGGCGGGDLVQYARVNSDGTTSTWTTSATLLPTGNCNGYATTYNGYIYVHGGTGAAGTSDDIYYAKPNANGDITSWTTIGSPAGSFSTHVNQAMAAYNGYIYVIGGETYDFSAPLRNVYYARINADGTLGSFTVQTNWIPLPFDVGNTAVVANGYMYVISGDDVYHGKINSDGSIATAVSTNPALPASSRWAGFNVLNGYLYVTGADSVNEVFYAQLANDGTVGSWTTDTTTLAGDRGAPGSVTVNGYIYVIGGSTGVATNTVFYSSGARVKVGAALDLVGYSGEGLSEGNSGGQLTAGTTFINGLLTVTGNANIKDGAVIGNELRVQANNNTTSAFTVYNAAAVPQFSIDSTNSYVYIGNPTADSTGALLILDNKNTSGDPTGVIGGMYYNSNTSKFRCFEGAAWVDCTTGGLGFLQNGNSFGATAVLGTNDANALELETGGITRLTVGATGGITLASGNSLTLAGGDSNIVATNAATGTTGTTTGTGSATTTLTLTSDAFSVNDVVLIDNAGQDFYTRITADPGTGSYTVSPAITFETGRTVTKYTAQNIGATTSDYATGTNRFFQGYFLGGIVTGSGSTTYSDQNITSTGRLAVSTVAGNSVSGFRVDTAMTGASGLQVGNVLAVTINPGGSSSGSHFGNEAIVNIGTAGTTFTDDIIANINQINWSGASNTSNTGRLIGTVGKVVTASGSGAVDNAIAVFGQAQYAVGTTVTNTYNMYAANLQSGATANLYGFYAENMTGGSTSNFPLFLASATPGQPLLSVSGTGAVASRNSTNSTTAFQVLNASAVPQFVADTTNSRVYIGNPTGDTTGALLILDTKTDAGDPTGVNGGMYYSSNLNKFRCYENSVWVNCIADAPQIFTFTASDTFDKADFPGLKAVIVEVQGGGGGSGGVAATAAGEVSISGAGGGGGYCKERILAASLATSETVTVGTGGAGGSAGANNGSSGGNSSFGSFCTGNGGTPGSGGTNGTSTTFFGAGNGGTATGGDINIPGSDGEFGIRLTTGPTGIRTASGGSSMLGGNIRMTGGGSGGAGVDGYLYGGGASGALNHASQTAKAGGTGGGGVIIVTLFF